MTLRDRHKSQVQIKLGGWQTQQVQLGEQRMGRILQCALFYEQFEGLTAMHNMLIKSLCLQASRKYQLYKRGNGESQI